MNNDIVFVIEHYQKGPDDDWHTRIDESKYIQFFKKVSEAIIDRVPNAIVMKNMIPKYYLDYDLYNNLVQNEDPSDPNYVQVPRKWSFEVSYKGMLIFSKLNGGYWPNCDLVADKCAACVENEAKGLDCTMYLAGNTPLKGGGYIQSSAKKDGKGRAGNSPNRQGSNAKLPVGKEVPFNQSFEQDRDQSLRMQEMSPP